MGYSVHYDGYLTIDPPISREHAKYINNFHNTRHMSRDPEKIKEEYPDWEKYSYNGDLGIHGEFFAPGKRGEKMNDSSVLNCNRTPGGCPGLWCDFHIDDDGNLSWVDSDKSEDGDLWIRYIIANFLEPWGYTVNGDITFQGDESNDCGVITVENNKLCVQYNDMGL